MLQKVTNSNIEKFLIREYNHIQVHDMVKTMRVNYNNVHGKRTTTTLTITDKLIITDYLRIVSEQFHSIESLLTSRQLFQHAYDEAVKAQFVKETSFLNIKDQVVIFCYQHLKTNSQMILDY